MDDKKYWGYGDISAELDLSYTTVRRNVDKMIKKKLIGPLSRKIGENGHYYACLSDTQYSKFKEWLRIRRKNESTSHMEQKEAAQDNGHFYVILLIPEFSKKRIKAGFSSRIDTRIAEHLTTVPTAKLIYSAPCMRSWESFLLSYVHSHGTKIKSEVFDVPNVNGMIKNLQTLFDQISKRK